MAIVLGSKILIAPVGLYEQRLWKAIVRSGAERIYLITESKSEYKITKTIAENLEKRIKTDLVAEVERKEADFSKFEDIYRVFVGIIEKEKAVDRNARIILDVTSTTKEAALVATNLASLYNLTISYVPGRKKVSAEFVERRYQYEKDDPGSEYTELFLALSGIRWSGFNNDELKVLYKVANERFESVNDLIGKLSEEGINSKDEAYKKRILRAVHALEEKGLILGEEIGRAKMIELTDVGKGIIEGIKEASEDLEKKV